MKQIKTIRAFYPEEFDKRVNDFIKAQSVNGISRVTSTQTHILPAIGEGDTATYIAILYYDEAKQ